MYSEVKLTISVVIYIVLLYYILTSMVTQLIIGHKYMAMEKHTYLH